MIKGLMATGSAFLLLHPQAAGAQALAGLGAEEFGLTEQQLVRAVEQGKALEMKRSGFDYDHPDDVEPDIRTRLPGLTSSGSLQIEKTTSEQRTELKKPQDYKWRVAAKTFKLQEEVLVPVEERIQQKLFAWKVQ